MIAKEDVMPELLAACPGFQEAWTKHLEWWGDAERGIFNDTGEFASYLVSSYQQGTTSEFDVAFRTIERILREGDAEARGAASIGVLESVQVQASHHPFGSDAFVKWLGPLSREVWREIDALWEAGGGSLMGVVRLEQQRSEETSPRRSWWPFRRSK